MSWSCMLQFSKCPWDEKKSLWNEVFVSLAISKNESTYVEPGKRITYLSNIWIAQIFTLIAWVLDDLHRIPPFSTSIFLLNAEWKIDTKVGNAIDIFKWKVQAWKKLSRIYSQINSLRFVWQRRVSFHCTVDDSIAGFSLKQARMMVFNTWTNSRFFTMNLI